MNNKGQIPWNKGNKKRYTKKCLICGEKFKVTNSRKDTAKYCSHKCQGKAQIGKNNPFYGKTHTKEVREIVRKTQKNRIHLKGELNHCWKGDNVSKETLHTRIESKFGKPSYCEICKKTDKKRYDWANKDHKYNLERKDWMRLCRSCHIKFDIENNNYKGFWWNSTGKHPTKK